MSPSASTFRGLGALHEGTSQITPVKVFTEKPDLVHFLQGVPVRSRARSPALIAPWFAFGPSLWVGTVAAPGAGLPVGLPSTGPQSLDAA